MQSLQLEEHADLKEDYSRWSAQPLRRHEVASLKCAQREQQVRHEMQNEDFCGQLNLR